MSFAKDEEVENKGPAVNYIYGSEFPTPAPSNYAYDRGVCLDHLALEEFSGFIFMCNGRTKPECYLYRVFGLPAGRREVIEKIRPGIKLFLFDYDVKYLYGVYDATTAGKLNLERTAFGGNFPAQVRFKIHRECLPLPESCFRHAIQDNYQKGSNKFNPILNSQQVSHLLSLFHPLTMPSSPQYDRSYTKDQFQPPERLPPSRNTYLNLMKPNHASQVSVPRAQHVPQGILLHQWDSHGQTGNMGLFHHAVEHPAFPNVRSQPAIAALPTGDQFQSAASLPSMKDPNAAWMYGGITSQVLEPQYIQASVPQPPYVSYGYTADTGYISSAVQPQAEPAPNQTFYPAEVPVLPAPKSYESYHRYEAAQYTVPTDQHMGLRYGYNQLPLQTTEAEIVSEAQLNAAQHHNHRVPTAPPHAAPSMQQHSSTSEAPGLTIGTVPTSWSNSWTGATPT